MHRYTEGIICNTSNEIVCDIYSANLSPRLNVWKRTKMFATEHDSCNGNDNDIWWLTIESATITCKILARGIMHHWNYFISDFRETIEGKIAHRLRDHYDWIFMLPSVTHKTHLYSVAMLHEIISHTFRMQCVFLCVWVFEFCCTLASRPIYVSVFVSLLLSSGVGIVDHIRPN